MSTIIILLILPIAIKLFTSWGTLKLKALPVKNISAEMVVEQMNSKKIRSLKVEEAYNYVYKEFHDKFNSKELSREQITAIRQYLSQSVKQYKHKKFKNDIHAIYTMLKATDISRRDLAIVQKIIS
ncbi:hypothetical protein FDB55_06660 [Clostridium botulinum]|uniref:hypothetical protein n=1 Tax=Clostridium botulinum TaxID=1491 RepID=UPI0013F05AA0|nr:hypothetical protein [Clostridium botulinum]MCS6110354.1 hypothetical protein [Clostridium botulinum]NFE12316.1 hypothetical protein [Clostridium botulinum]NFE84597.1 hypothetical protein [Clostridium botulinum]NFL42187.1 hypothetical protein [Clostridium botulinum]NFN21420.1 hypothetical protein [Clostridium botulinum]